MECSVHIKNNQGDFFTVTKISKTLSKWQNQGVQCVDLGAFTGCVCAYFLSYAGKLRNCKGSLSVKGRVQMGTVQLG